MFDFDDLEEEIEAIEEKARPQAWRPVPDEVWRGLPPVANEKTPKNFKEFKERVNEKDVGEYWGLDFPFTPTMLREMGPKWLTQAMHTAGTLPKENEITRFLEMSVHAEDVTKEDAENAKWGGAGIKILLKVAYKSGPGDLTEWMFIKMPHEFTGKNERQRNSLNNPSDWNEVTWYNVFAGSHGTVPFRVPRMYFCDMSRKTTNFVNIIEMVGRSTGPEDRSVYTPAPEKYKDWDLPNNGVDFYYAHTKTMAQLFGWHKVTREKTTQVEDLFLPKEFQAFLWGVNSAIGESGPYLSKARDAKFGQMLKDPGVQGYVGSLRLNSPQSTRGFLDYCKNLVLEVAPHIFPKELTEKAFTDRFFKEAGEMSLYCAEMMFYLQCMPEYFSLVHPNAQVDNAWYWRDPEGTLNCGLLDWGGVGHGTIPNCLANGWMGAEAEVMDEHEPKLIRLFCDEYEKVTGVKLDFDDVHMHVKLGHAIVLFGCCANIGMLYRVFKKDDWAGMKSRKDPKIQNNFLMRCYFVQIELFLKMFKKRSPYPAFKEWMKKVKLPPKKVE